jgi:hypothetical protein
MRYRPWGPINWALSLSSNKQWNFVGAFGTEERSLCSWEQMRQKATVVSELFAQIFDVDSEKYREHTKIAFEARIEEFISKGGDVTNILSFGLMDEWFRISEFARKAENKGSSIVLDITSLPKRFFFPILKTMVNSTKVRNLLVTYTSPASYVEGELYEDIEPWRTLPEFGGTRNKPDLWVVSVGFLVESLRQYVGGSPEEKMKILIPFPSALAVLRRTWLSVANLEQGHSDGRFDKYRVETLDMSAAFDRICSLAGNPPKHLAFAPFGPKPTSAAMCIYALQRESSVHYPQPTVYHPEYTKGIRNNDPESAVNAYWVKHENEFLYAV